MLILAAYKTSKCSLQGSGGTTLMWAPAVREKKIGSLQSDDICRGCGIFEFRVPEMAFPAF